MNIMISSSTLLLTPGPRTATRCGDRAFSVIVPSLWNKLPLHVHNTHSLDQFKTTENNNNNNNNDFIVRNGKSFCPIDRGPGSH